MQEKQNKTVDNSTISPDNTECLDTTPTKEDVGVVAVKKGKQVKYRRPTIRQLAFERELKKALADPKAYAEKYGKVTLKNIAKNAGYGDETASNTHKIRRKENFALTVREEIDLLNKRLKEAYEILERENERARYQDATQAIERLSKQRQLLTGRATENIQFKIVEEEETAQ